MHRSTNSFAALANQAECGDPAAQYERARGRGWSAEALSRMMAAPAHNADGPACAPAPTACRAGDLLENTARGPLTLPPGGVQIVSIDPDASYFGDGISPVNASDSIDVQWGTGGQYLFGGLAMVDSHLHGCIRIEFD